MTDQPTCKTCRYWGPSFTVQRDCRRNAPLESNHVHGPDWPQTKESHWCGEHKPIKAEDPRTLKEQVDDGLAEALKRQEDLDEGYKPGQVKWMSREEMKSLYPTIHSPGCASWGTPAFTSKQTACDCHLMT